LRAFGCRLLIHDPAAEAGEEAAPLDRVLRESDIVTLHCPSTPETRQLINAGSISRMKRGALLINASRGDLVETTALEEALQSGQLGGAGLDVCDPEP
ncbi:MAG: C-terminal binding protein, partial [Akkermansiaceae bacterium]|nr:C-terminal binding protein [Akkermansiaceae bacterium]